MITLGDYYDYCGHHCRAVELPAWGRRCVFAVTPLHCRLPNPRLSFAKQKMGAVRNILEQCFGPDCSVFGTGLKQWG